MRQNPTNIWRTQGWSMIYMQYTRHFQWHGLIGTLRSHMESYKTSETICSVTANICFAWSAGHKLRSCKQLPNMCMDRLIVANSRACWGEICGPVITSPEYTAPWTAVDAGHISPSFTINRMYSHFLDLSGLSLRCWICAWTWANKMSFGAGLVIIWYRNEPSKHACQKWN